MACQALWNTISDKSFHSDVLSEIDFMHSIKESKNKDIGCIFCNGKSEGEREEVWIQWFNCSLWAHCTGAKNAEYMCTFICRLETEMFFP